MKTAMSVLVMLIAAFALVSGGEACPWFSCNNNNPAVSAEANNAFSIDGFRDADRPGSFPTGTPYPCITFPAYPDYTDARAIPCPLKDRVRMAPEPMGSPGV